MKADWYTINNAAEIDSPSLIIYPDRVKSNIKLLKSFVSDTGQLRPHIKTHKCPEVIRLMLEAGLTKFKCATIAEAEILAKEGAKDVLLAYQPLGPKAERFCQLQRNFAGTIFSCLIDNEKTLEDLSAMASGHHLTVRVFLDLNVGMNRTGIRPGQEALALYQKAVHTKNIDIIGLHAYDGHLRDADLQVRTRKCNEAFLPVIQLQTEIKKITGRLPLIVAGGTPTFPIHAQNKNVECSPGTFIFWDKGYENMLAEQPFRFAALVMTRIISKPDNETICVDLGHKSIASENVLSNRVYFLNAPELEPIGHSEEHMVFKTDKHNAYQVGDVLYGIPHHICPTVSLYDFAAVCNGNTCLERWAISARKRTVTI